MFENLFNIKKTKNIYLAGWEVLLNGDQQCENFIATQITNKKTVKTLYSGIELVFENEKLVKAYDYQDGNRKYRKLKADEVGLTYKKYKENKILKFVEDKNGMHQLGGEVPNEFKINEIEDLSIGFQYLGFISNEDNKFSWLPFKMHLACPIYLNFEFLFLDYSNPNKPKIINKEEINIVNTSYPENLNENSEIIFNEMKFNYIESIEFEGINDGGIPQWAQYPTIPNCPISGKRMKFLCQLNGGVTTNRTNIIPLNDWDRKYYEQLNFWGDGDLYIFFEPTEKTACYFIQNT